MRSVARGQFDVKLDFADSGQDLERYCLRADVAPGAVLLDGSACDESVAQMRARVRAAGGAHAVIEIADGDEFDIDPSSDKHVGRVGRRALASALPAALVLSMSASMAARRFTS